MKVEAKVAREPGERNFSCYMHIKSLKCGVLGEGHSAKEAMDDMMRGWNDEEDELREQGKNIPELEIVYRFDIGSLFNYYNFINVTGLSREINISPSVMRQYATGVRKPSPERKRAIISGIRSLATKMEAAEIY